MADFNAGDLVLWSYIQDIYGKINTGRTKFSIGSTITIPSNPGTVEPDEISTIQTYLNQFNNNTYVKNSTDAQSALNSITIPTRGTLLKPLNLQSTINTINNVCTYDASFFSSNHSFRGSFFSSDNSFRGTFFSSDYGFRATFFSNNNGLRSSFFSSNNGFRSTFFSSNNTFRSAYNTSYNTSNNGFRSSNFTSFFAQRSTLKGTR